MWWAGVIICFAATGVCGVQPIGRSDAPAYTEKQECVNGVDSGLSAIIRSKQVRQAVLEGQVFMSGGCIERMERPRKQDFMRRFGPSASETEQAL